MNKPFYSDYVRHAMRFYARNHEKTPQFKSDADRQNWVACDKVIKKYNDMDRVILIYVYGAYDTLPDNVYEKAKEFKINQNIIWDTMKEFERKVAKKRGLI